MMRINRKKIIKGIGIIFVLLICLYVSSMNKKINKEEFEKNIDIINEECNKVFTDIDGSEKKYIKLLETEKDYLKRGMYSSVLVQINIIKQDYKQAIKYSESAVENYNKVNGGEYYAIAQQEYLAWGMYDVGQYVESFIAADTLLEMINDTGEDILTDEKFTETEGLIYSIFLRIYIRLDILEQAEIYYNKLCQNEYSNDFKVAYSKMEYANKINDAELRKKYATEYYEIVLKLDKKNETNMADAEMLPLGIANIHLGQYEEAIDQIQRAEDVYISMGDSLNLARTYGAYATYYEAIKNFDLAIDYYNKAIDIYYNNQNYYELQPIIKGVIRLKQENNIINNIEKYYSIDYTVSEKLREDKTLNKLISHIISVNAKLNNSEMFLLEKENDRNTIIIVLASVVILLLIILINKNNKTKKVLKDLANIDNLTKINNRASGENLILSKINNNCKFSIAIMDIDDFKKINDKYGHIYGDYILKEFARYINMALDKDDILFRFGGEEFVIAFVNQDKETAKNNLDKIRRLVNEIVFENNVTISFSAGVVQWNETSLDEVIKEADELMYKAKRAGKNRVL